ncbi:MAG TPA: ATP synthase subunit I [Candidatus Sulfotelmatobacter sp.]|nr:ATP synthase subunit I [Candidatus Sulfotelmatobacter sp.]
MVRAILNVNQSMSSIGEGPAQAAEAEKFYSSALFRIRNFMLVLGPAICTGAWIKFGWRAAAGLLLGCIIAYLNFQWLKSGVSGLADKVTNSGKRQSAKGIVARFLLRYALLGLAAYAILTSFPASLAGLFAGLFLPVAAIVCEAAYEICAGLRQGTGKSSEEN